MGRAILELRGNLVCLDTPEWQGGVVALAEMSGLPGAIKKFFSEQRWKHLTPQMNFAVKRVIQGERCSSLICFRWRRANFPLCLIF